MRWLLKPVFLPGSELTGNKLLAARAVAAGISIAALMLFTIALPARAAWLNTYADQVIQASDPNQNWRIILLAQAFPRYGLILEGSVILLYFLTAMFLFYTRSDDWFVLFTISGLSAFALHITPTLYTWMLATPDFAFIGDIFKGMGIGLALLFLYLFPSGYYAPRWMRLFIIAWIIWVVIWIFNPQSLFAFRDPYTISPPGFVLLMFWWGTGIFAQIYRYRRVSGRLEQQQTKFVTLGATIVVIGYSIYVPLREMIGWLPNAALGQQAFQLLAPYIFLLMVATVPITISFSILRFRLWDIDLIIRRTLIYGALTATLIGIYFGIVFILQALVFGRLNSLPLSALVATTIGVTLMIDPLRRQIQDGIDRRFYRQKYDAEKTLEAFNQSVDYLTDLDAVCQRLIHVTRETVSPKMIGIWIKECDDLPFVSNEGSHGTQPIELEIAADDPFLRYCAINPGVIELDSVQLDSPSLAILNRARVRLAAPLVSQGEMIGLLYVGPRRSQQDYSSDDRRLLNNLATRAAPALRVAQLARQQQVEALKRERLEHELRVARLIQETLLPKELPSLASYHFAAHWQPARVVSGDFYDFLNFRDGRLGIFVADVTDKGVPAALVMAASRAVLRESAGQFIAPGEVLARANQLLVPDIPRNMFITCLYILLTPSSGEFIFANAGHNLPIQRCKGQALELRARGMPLGLMPDMPYEEQSGVLKPGESLLLYSDGLIEAHNAQGEMFESPRLIQTIQPIEGGDSQIQTSLRALAEFTGPDWEQEDDVTLVVIERLSVGADGKGEMGDHKIAEIPAKQLLIEFEIDSAPGNERLVVEHVVAAIGQFNLAQDRLERLKTAVAETAMNALEHGNQYRADLKVQVRVFQHQDVLSVIIQDHGSGLDFQEPAQPNLEAKLAGLQSPRGWGLFLIRNMVDEMHIQTDQTGTTVELEISLKEQ